MEARLATNSAERLDRPSGYLYRQATRSEKGREDLEKTAVTKTVYVGNLSFFTSEEQIYDLFSRAGPINHIIMGLDRINSTPCGFCFVVYETSDGARNAVKYLHLTKLDDRDIKIDLDPGFKEGRQFGRGSSGGQVADEYRETYDPGRGGYGRIIQQRDERAA